MPRKALFSWFLPYIIRRPAALFLSVQHESGVLIHFGPSDPLGPPIVQDEFGDLIHFGPSDFTHCSSASHAGHRTYSGLRVPGWNNLKSV